MKLQKCPYKDVIATDFLFDARQGLKKGQNKTRRTKTQKVDEKADTEEKPETTEGFIEVHAFSRSFDLAPRPPPPPTPHPPRSSLLTVDTGEGPSPSVSSTSDTQKD